MSDKFKFSYEKEDMERYDDEYFCKEKIVMECEDCDVNLFKVFESFRRFLISCGYIIKDDDRIDIVPTYFDRDEYEKILNKENEVEKKLLNEENIEDDSFIGKDDEVKANFYDDDFNVIINKITKGFADEIETK